MTNIEIKMTALYRFCLHAYQEYAAWTEHEAVYTESLKQDHDTIAEYLDFQASDTENDDKISVSFKLKKADLLPVTVQAQMTSDNQQ